MHVRVKFAGAVAVAGAMAVAGTVAIADDGDRISKRLTGYEEVPAVSTAASGQFKATLRPSQGEIAYRVSYTGLEGNVLQSHIHVGQLHVNGGISVFLCSNLGNGPAGTPACPPAPATVEGVLRPASVVGPNDQGVAPGEFDELVRAMEKGVTYANVHSSKFPSGEIRGQLRVDD